MAAAMAVGCPAAMNPCILSLGQDGAHLCTWSAAGRKLRQYGQWQNGYYDNGQWRSGYWSQSKPSHHIPSY